MRDTKIDYWWEDREEICWLKFNIFVKDKLRLSNLMFSEICYTDEEGMYWYVIHIADKFIEDDYILNPSYQYYSNVEAAKKFVTNVFLEIFPAAREKE